MRLTTSVKTIETLNKKCRFFWRLDEIFSSRPNNTPVITVDSLHTNDEPSHSQNNLSIEPELFVNSMEWPDSDRDDNDNNDDLLSSNNESTPTPLSSHSRKRKEPASTPHQRGKRDIDLHHMFELNWSQWAAQEEKRVKMEADSKRELYILQCQQEKERDERMALREREREERQYKWQREQEKEREERQHELLKNLLTTVIKEIRG